MLILLRTLIHIGCVTPLIWLVSVLVQGDEIALGADPIKELIHILGYTAIVIFCLSFILGILLQWVKLPQYQILRRPLGLWAFGYALCHIIAYLWLELALDGRLFLDEIVRRPYLLLGVSAFLILTIMAATSLPALKHKLGKNWGKLHQLGYIALICAVGHYLLAVKSITLAPLVISGLALLILGWRWLRRFS